MFIELDFRFFKESLVEDDKTDSYGCGNHAKTSTVNIDVCLVLEMFFFLLLHFLYIVNTTE